MSLDTLISNPMLMAELQENLITSFNLVRSLDVSSFNFTAGQANPVFYGPNRLTGLIVGQPVTIDCRGAATCTTAGVNHVNLLVNGNQTNAQTLWIPAASGQFVSMINSFIPTDTSAVVLVNMTPPGGSSCVVNTTVNDYAQTQIFQ